MKKIFTITFFVAVAMMTYVSCGGEGPDDPIDTDHVVVDDNEPVDNDVEPTDDTVDTEPTDDIQENENPDDDGLVDNEPTDNDTAPVSCSENEACKEGCKEFLDREGRWNLKIPTGLTGKITITLSFPNSKCNIAVSEKWEFMWEGNILDDLGCVEYSPAAGFFSLPEMEGEMLVINKYFTQEECTTDTGSTPYKFEKL